MLMTSLQDDKDWFRETDHELQELRERVARLERIKAEQQAAIQRLERLKDCVECLLDLTGDKAICTDTCEPLPWGDLD
jgi:prefoldin subunit 5